MLPLFFLFGQGRLDFLGSVPEEDLIEEVIVFLGKLVRLFLEGNLLLQSQTRLQGRFLICMWFL
jgi:hypothetical protein